MASMSEQEKLKAEIAKLSGAIQTHKQQQQHPPSHQPYASGYPSRGRGYYPSANTSSYRGGYNSARGGYHASTTAGRGRGRGASAAPIRNRTLILNDSTSKPASSSSITTDPQTDTTGAESTANAASKTGSASAAPADGWIKRKSTHNMSLVSTSTFQRTEPARLAALEATRKAKAEAKAASSSSAAAKKASRGKASKPTSSIRRGDNMGEVVIDGVVFEFDPSGTKLVKKAIQPSASDAAPETSSSSSSDPSSSSAVPLKTSVNGQEYIRTKRGNLISADLLAKRRTQREAAAKMGRLDKMVGQISAIQATRNAASRTKPGSRTLHVNKSRTLCTFFNKTGQCKRGLSCPYMHDASKIALCPKVLKPGGCTLPKGTCPLSHTPRAERVPHCVHYLRTGKCRNGDECLYTHSDKLRALGGVGAKICRDFSDYGWCEKGQECEQRHTYECPDFVEKGKCDRKGCKLVHIIRATDAHEESAGADEGGATMEEEGEGMQNGDLFMRDDAAAAEEEEEIREGTGGKRKRPLMQTELDDGQVLPHDDDHEGDDGADEEVNFANQNDSRSTKRRKAKAFTQQRDYISFNDDDEDEDEQDGDEEEDDGEEQEEASEDEDEHSEVASVHSEDFEISDAEASEDEDAEEEDDDDQNVGDSTMTISGKGHQAGEEAQGETDSDDDDAVDRDL